ncbi:unnamed protein product, partial [Ascophyllum nodosum]
MVRTLKDKASIPQRRVLLARTEELLVDLQGSVATVLRGQYVSITTDGWTPRANESYISFTVVYVNDDWKMVTLALSCSKKQGSTKGEDLAASIEAMVETHGLTGHVVVGNTDCEPSMVKAGRILTEKGVLMYIGCTCHRIEYVTALVFHGPGVKKSMTLARAVVTRYTKLSQAAEQLRELCGIVGIIPLRVIQDVETRWWSTQSMAERLVYLRRAVELHESLNDVAPLLGPVDWNVFELLEPVLAPFMYVQKKLESNNVTGTLVVPLICDLRIGLELERKTLQQPTPGASADVLAVRPRGFRKVQVMATALDPRCKMLYYVLPNEHEGVWQAVAMAAADIAKSKASIRATVSSAAGSTPAVGSTPGGPGLGASARPASKRFCSGFMAASQAQATSASTATAAPSLPAEHFLKEAESEVTRYRAASGLAMEVAQESGKILYPDPLDWWRINAVKFPLLAALARRLLAIPASQAQSERVFSSAGQIVTQTRNRLSSENVELLVALKNI